MNEDEVSAKLEKNLKEKEAKQELFQEKVIIIGELHTQRALWANKIGQLKSFSIIQTNELDEDYRERLKKLEGMVGEISRKITGFKPESLDQLKHFRQGILDDLKALEAHYEALEKAEAEAAPGAPETPES